MRRVAAMQSEELDHDALALELDSHADSPVVGKYARILEDTQRKASVSGFSDQLGAPLEVKIVNAAVLYECDITGLCYLLIIRNALYLPTMTVSLIPPFMMRLQGVHVNECPKFLAQKPTVEHHSVYFPENDIRFPLLLDRTISYLPVRMPTDDELSSTKELEITPMLDHWDPHSLHFQEQEEAMVNYRGEIKEKPERTFIVSSVISRALEDELLYKDLHDGAVKGGFSELSISVIKTANGTKSTLQPKHLMMRWNIGLEAAKQTLQVTTRLCPRNTTSITLNRRYEYNDRMLRYRRLSTDIFSDTMYASKRTGKSVRNYTCAQVFATDFGWIHVIPMTKEKDCHLAFKSLFKDFGVPSNLILDGAKAQIEGESRKVCQKAGCTIKELEKEVPSANRAERAIQTLKNETRRDMRAADSPLVFWCLCIERRARINCATAKDNFNLKGDTPHSMLTGELTDISNLCNFAWYEWVKFRREGPQADFPYPTEHLGRCLRPIHQ